MEDHQDTLDVKEILSKFTAPEKKDPRPTWDEYFMQIAHVVSIRGTCDRGQAGCVVVKDKAILTTGYVGSPKGLPHCDDEGHLIKTMTHANGKTSQHCVRTLHAEMNALLQAARKGVSVEGATMYCKMMPCLNCAMGLINAGIRRLVAEKRYHADEISMEMLEQAGVKVEILRDEMVKYDDM